MPRPGAGGETLWYFGYGSNLDPRTFLGRRRMRPSYCAVAHLRDWELCFDLAAGRGERAFANLRAGRDAHVWGVAYAISAPEARWLDRTEGVHWGAYRRQPIEVRLPGDRIASVSAFTYVSLRRTPHRRPSRRYMGLLLRGARHHALPDNWIAHLHSVPLASDEPESARPRPL